MGQTRNALQVENLKVRDNFGEPAVDKRIILKWILNKYGVNIRAGFIWLKVESSGGPLEYDSESSFILNT
jgi:hypothetical protein